MFPTDVISSGSLSALLFYTVCLGMLLLVGVILRVKLKIFKKYIIPSALIAGFIGLGLGPHGVGFLPEEMVSTWRGYAGILITIVFAPMLIGVTLNMKRVKETQAVSQIIYSWSSSFLQWGIPLIITGLILTPMFGINPMFGSLFEIGWSGGHGTAGGMAEAFKNLNWEAGASLGLTVATIGLLVGIIGGVIIINYGIRKGYTNYINKDADINRDQSSDIIPKSEQSPSSMNTIKNDVVDGYAFHFTLISIAIFIGWVLHKLVGQVISGMPLFPMAMIGGIIVSIVLKRTIFYEAINIQTFRRIQGFALDLLIVAAVATISIPVVIEYFIPLVVLSVVTLVLMIWFFFYLGPRMFKKDWFEHSILIFGTSCGVAAVGYMLLRTVDPKLESDAFIAYGLRSPFVSPFSGGGLVTSLVPILALTYGALITGIGSMVVFVLVLLLAKMLGVYGKASHKSSGISSQSNSA